MFLAALLILAFGPLDWSFPWWVWALALMSSSGDSLEQSASIRMRARE